MIEGDTAMASLTGPRTREYHTFSNESWRYRPDERSHAIDLKLIHINIINKPQK